MCSFYHTKDRYFSLISSLLRSWNSLTISDGSSQSHWFSFTSVPLTQSRIAKELLSITTTYFNWSQSNGCFEGRPIVCAPPVSEESILSFLDLISSSAVDGCQKHWKSQIAFNFFFDLVQVTTFANLLLGLQLIRMPIFSYSSNFWWTCQPVQLSRRRALPQCTVTLT